MAPQKHVMHPELPAAAEYVERLGGKFPVMSKYKQETPVEIPAALRRSREKTKPFSEVILAPAIPPDSPLVSRLRTLKETQARDAAERTVALRSELARARRARHLEGMEQEGKIVILHPPGLTTPLIPSPFPDREKNAPHPLLTETAEERAKQFLEARRAVAEFAATAEALGESDEETTRKLKRRERDYRAALLSSTKNEIAGMLGLAQTETAEKRGTLDAAAKELADVRVAWMDLEAINKKIKQTTGLTAEEVRDNPLHVNRGRGIRGLAHRFVRSFHGRIFNDPELETLLETQKKTEERWTRQWHTIDFDRSPAGIAASKIAQAFIERVQRKTKNEQMTQQQLALISDAKKECRALIETIDDLGLELAEEDDGNVITKIEKIKKRLETLKNVTGIAKTSDYRNAVRELELLEAEMHTHQEQAAA